MHQGTWRDSDAWTWALDAIRPALDLSSADFLDEARRFLADHGVVQAVALRDTATIYDWLLTAMQYQGISDANAGAFLKKNGTVGWSDIAPAMATSPSCKRLTSYWHFHDCRYQKTAWTCANPEDMNACPLPTHPIRNGRLSQGAYSLFLFMRDVCDGDFVGWIDHRLELANNGEAKDRAHRMRQAILDPMRNMACSTRYFLWRCRACSWSAILIASVGWPLAPE